MAGKKGKGGSEQTPIDERSLAIAIMMDEAGQDWATMPVVLDSAYNRSTEIGRGLGYGTRGRTDIKSVFQGQYPGRAPEYNAWGQPRTQQLAREIMAGRVNTPAYQEAAKVYDSYKKDPASPYRGAARGGTMYQHENPAYREGFNFEAQRQYADRLPFGDAYGVVTGPNLVKDQSTWDALQSFSNRATLSLEPSPIGEVRNQGTISPTGMQALDVAKAPETIGGGFLSMGTADALQGYGDSLGSYSGAAPDQIAGGEGGSFGSSGFSGSGDMGGPSGAGGFGGDSLGGPGGAGDPSGGFGGGSESSRGDPSGGLGGGGFGGDPYSGGAGGPSDPSGGLSGGGFGGDPYSGGSSNGSDPWGGSYDVGGSNSGGLSGGGYGGDPYSGGSDPGYAGGYDSPTGNQGGNYSGAGYGANSGGYESPGNSGGLSGGGWGGDSYSGGGPSGDPAGGNPGGGFSGSASPAEGSWGDSQSGQGPRGDW